METVLIVLAGLLVGAVAALKVFAPKTKNTVDDRLLAKLEQLEALVKGLLPSEEKSASKALAAKASKPAAKK